MYRLSRSQAFPPPAGQGRQEGAVGAVDRADRFADICQTVLVRHVVVPQPCFRNPAEFFRRHAGAAQLADQGHHGLAETFLPGQFPQVFPLAVRPAVRIQFQQKRFIQQPLQQQFLSFAADWHALYAGRRAAAQDLMDQILEIDGVQPPSPRALDQFPRRRDKESFLPFRTAVGRGQVHQRVHAAPPGGDNKQLQGSLFRIHPNLPFPAAFRTAHLRYPT